MFKKKPQIKTLSPLRSSDRRKLADKIIQDYCLKQDSQAEEPLSADQQADQTAAHTALRRSLLPDNSLSAKFTTTSGPDLKQITGTVYVGSHGAPEQRVLWVKIDEQIYPSVYSLWKNPGILPLLHTPSLVIGKLKGGADLMTPGLAGPPFPSKAKQGCLVCIASLDSPSVPVAVGTCVIDVSALQKTQGEKGHAVETFHFAGDELWDWSTSGKTGSEPPEEIPEWITNSDTEVRQAMESLEIDEGDDVEADGGVTLPRDSGGGAIADGRSTTEDPGGDNSLVEVVDAAPAMTTTEIDDVFWRAFLFGVHNAITTKRNEPKYGFNLPLSQSVFMSEVVHPYLPIHTPADAQALQMKRTSWKTARKFINALGKAKLILNKDYKTEAMVLDIDFDDQSFTAFRPYRLPKKEPVKSAPNGVSETVDDGVDDSVGQKLKIQILYRPKDSLLPLFDAPNTPKLAFYTAADIRSAVADYVQASGLIDAVNKRQVKLDPVISNAVLSAASRPDAEILSKGLIARDALVDRVLSLCAKYHLILRNDETTETSKAKPKAGDAPKVGILVEKRGGNKTATRTYGLEPFSIKPQPLADELRKACASSTSVEPFKGGKGMEVMVQGPQTDAVCKALARRGVVKAWIEVNDKTKGKKS